MSLSLAFLGTGAGISPSLTRACSSTLLTIGGENSLIDCAEGSHLQLKKLRAQHAAMNRRASSNRQPNRTPRMNFKGPTRIFITHLHMDHCMGLPMFLIDLLSRDYVENSIVDVYGPPGLRTLLRTIYTVTTPSTNDNKYKVHELLKAGDTPTPCSDDVLFTAELPGENIMCDDKGGWVDFCSATGFKVSASNIEHRALCFGYVFDETNSRSARKVVYLGDTSDPSPISRLAQNADVLIHEATYAHIVKGGEPNKPQNSKANIDELALKRGHSTAAMAGAFAKSINARILALNHFSQRYADIRSNEGVMKQFEQQARDAGATTVKATRDLMLLHILEDDSSQWTVL